MAVYIIGDIHFTNSHEWDAICFNRFIDYFANLDVEENSSLLLLGDINDRKINDGPTVGYATKFISIALEKFSNIYILGGNHEAYEDDTHKVYYNTEYLKYLNKDRIHLIYDEAIMDIDDLKVIALPFKACSSEIDDYYNNELNNEFYSTPVDLIVGHLAIYDDKLPIAGGLDLTKFNFKTAYFGHIHSRVGSCASFYTGSVMPVKQSENKTDLPRIIAKVSKNNIEEIELPIFKVFEKVDISVDLPKYKKDNDPVYVYDFINCNDETTESFRKDFFIRYEKDALDLRKDEKDGENEFTIVDQLFENFYEAYLMMCKSLDVHPKRSVSALIKSLLET